VLRFTPAEAGTLLAVVSGARALLVRMADEAATVDALWDAVSTGANIQAVVEALASGGLFSTPPFALFEATTGSPTAGFTITCIVRGDIPLELTTLSGTETVDASGVTTWVERSVAGVVAFQAGTPAGTSALPVVGAAAWASSIAWTAGASTAAPTAAVSSAAARPIIPSAVPAAAAPVAPATIASVPEPAPVPVAEPPQAPAPQIPEHTIAAQTVTSSAIDDLVAAASAAAAPQPETPGSGYDSLFEETMMRSIEDAAVRPPSEDDDHGDAAATPPASGDAASHDTAGDHDGMTVMSGDIAKLRASRRGRKAAASDAAVEAPVAYTLALSTGGVESLDGLALVGRSPSVSKVSGGQVPKLIAIPGDQDISRNHVQFAVEGGTVVVTDLHSRNGTTITLPGKSPQLLRQGESTSVLVGTVVDLGGGVTITVGHEQ